MRRLLPSSLAFVVAISAVACAAPTDEEVGSAEGAAAVGDTVSAEEAALLRDGSGLSCDGTTQDGFLLCTHERGVVVLSESGVALLQTKGEDVTAKARAHDAAEKQDVADVLDTGGAGDTTTQGLRPQGLLSGRLLVDLVEALLRSTRRAVVNEAEVVATRSSEKAGNLVSLQRELRAGQSMYKGPMGATVLAGQTEKATVDATRMWAKATGRKIFGVSLPGAGQVTTRENVEAFMSMMRAERSKLAPGEKLTIMYSPAIGSREVFLELAEREGFDVLWFSPIRNIEEGFAPRAIVVPPGTVNFSADDGLIRRIASRMYSVDARFVGPI